MLVKVVGGVMLAVGAFYALQWLFSILVAIGSIGLVAGLMYLGWRLFTRES